MQQQLELRSAMAMGTENAHGDRECKRKRGGADRWQALGSGGGQGGLSGARPQWYGERTRQGGGGRHGGSALLHGRHAQATCWPFTHSPEQVSCDGLDAVGCDFGPATGQIRTWAKNEVCCPRAALHFSFKGDGH